MNHLQQLVLLDTEWGWKGFVLAAIGCLVAVVVLNELAAHAMKRKRRGKHRRY